MGRTSAMIALAFFSAAMLWGQKTTVSVSDLAVTGGISADECRQLTRKLLNELAAAGIYDVLDIGKRDQILKEQEFQMTGACDQASCLVEVGQLLGVQKMIGGSIGKLGNAYSVELQMVDVRTSRVDVPFSRSYSGNASVLLGAMREAALEFGRWKPGTQVTSNRLKVEYGSVRVISKPSGAKIKVDGSLVGETPAQLDRIEVGKCQIRLEKDGYLPYETTVEVNQGAPASVNTQLIKAAATSAEVRSATSPKGDKKAEPGTELVNERDGSVLVLVPAGAFVMGSNGGNNDERPEHRVYLDDYYIGKYEVSIGQYRKFCNATGHRFPEQPEWNGGDGYPVVNLTWNDAKVYCEWAGLRLPSEAEWEKAARGSDGRSYPWGNNWEAGMCNIYKNDDGYERTAPIESYPDGASPYGCFNMAGNVWEWCHDWYDESYYSRSPKANPGGGTAGVLKVLRGGSWAMNAGVCRTTGRCAYAPDSIGTSIGFRVAR